MMRKWIAGLLLILLLLSAGACSFGPNDKAWISEEKFSEAARIYDRSTSLELTEQALRQSKTWQNAEVNEAIYRLVKINRLEKK